VSKTLAIVGLKTRGGIVLLYFDRSASRIRVSQERSHNSLTHSPFIYARFLRYSICTNQVLCITSYHDIFLACKFCMCRERRKKASSIEKGDQLEVQYLLFPERLPTTIFVISRVCVCVCFRARFSIIIVLIIFLFLSI